MKALNTTLKAFMTKVKVSERAVMQRLNRALKPSGRLVKRCKVGSRNHEEFGELYVVDRASVVAKRIDLDHWAREAGVMQGYEVIGEFQTFGDCQTALADSMLRFARGTMLSVDIKDVCRDSGVFNRKMRGTLRAARVTPPMTSGGMEVLGA